MTEDREPSSADEIRARLGFSSDYPDESLAPGLNRLTTDTVFGAIWARPGLAARDRMLATLAALTSMQYLPQLGRYAEAAITIGLSPRAIQEVVIHCGLYAGFPSILNGLASVRETFEAQGVDVPDTAMPIRDRNELAALGDEVMTALHGPRAQAGYADPGNPVAEIYRVAVDYGYGDIWTRPGLDRRDRLIVALASFTALQMTSQVAKFAQAARDNGLSATEIVEAIGQTAPYSGFPKALNAVAAIEAVLRD